MDIDEDVLIQDANIDDAAEDFIVDKINQDFGSSVCIRKCNLDSSRLQRILDRVENPTCIFEVDITGCKVGPSAIHSIFRPDILPSTVIVADVGIGDDGLKDLLPFLSSIRILSLRNNNLTSKGVTKLFSVPNLNLVSLDLSENRIDDSAAFSITPCVKDLDLSSNLFTPRGLQILCSTLGNGAVKSLNLSGMKFGSANESIANLYDVHSSIKKLYLRNCSLKMIPRINTKSKLKLFDITNNSVPNFDVSPTVTIIGTPVTVRTSANVHIPRESLEKMKQRIEQLLSIGDSVDDDTGELRTMMSEVDKLSCQINEKMSMIQSKIKRKRAPRCLSSYASKVANPRDSMDVSEFCDSSASGMKLAPNFSLHTRILVLIQYLSLVHEMNMKSMYLTDFKADAFVLTQESKLILKDKGLICFTKTDSGVSRFLREFVGVDPCDISISSLLFPVIPLRCRATTYEVERTTESVMNLFRQLSHSELVSSFKLSVKGESAVDHGGVLRDVMTEFWQNVSRTMFVMSDTSVSLLPSEGDFRTIGRIMSKCLIESIPIAIPMHSIIFRWICNQLPVDLNDWVASVAEYDPQLASNIGYEAQDDNEICERCREVLVERRRKALEELTKGFFEIGIVGQIVKYMTDWWNLAKEIIGEVEFSGSQLLEQIAFVGYEGYEKARQVWVDVIKEFTQKDISHFIRLVTGIGSIPAGGFVSRGKRLIISRSNRLFAHTCTFELESPTFRKHEVLRESLAVAFVSLDADPSLHEWFRQLNA